MEKKADGAAKGKGKNTGKTQASSTMLSTDRLIKSLVMVLHAETIEMAFPYLTLHRQCWRLLRHVEGACDEVLRGLYMPAYMSGNRSCCSWLATSSGPPVRRPLQHAAKAFNG
ncbi:hypothetical protein N657DRAFT_647814 [Parathielavia appendiculata]|uniref:Uncharacterized protein n=1 Tax=Parathielavia appendiculata TaxID=2587402 RepID=A0AAN6Z1P7_9PEZI|nr:hypothetical protein N657DRAFT_647814 [Parathielavia appendiculata]